MQLVQQPPCTGGLVPRNPDKVPSFSQSAQTAADVRVKIPAVEVFSEAGLSPLLTFGSEIEPGPEVLEGFSVVTALSDDLTEDGGESMPRDIEPIRPSTVFGGLID